LQSNDATAAFAGLIDAQTIEDKASSYKGSAPEEKDEDEEDVKPKKKPMPKIKPKKKILAKKKAPKKKKADAALVGATEEISESTEKEIEASSKLTSTPEAAKAAEEPELPKKKSKIDASKKALRGC
jgi:hypothetical protein